MWDLACSSEVTLVIFGVTHGIPQGRDIGYAPLVFDAPPVFVAKGIHDVIACGFFAHAKMPARPFPCTTDGFRALRPICPPPFNLMLVPSFCNAG